MCEFVYDSAALLPSFVVSKYKNKKKQFKIKKKCLKLYLVCEFCFFVRENRFSIHFILSFLSYDQKSGGGVKTNLFSPSFRKILFYFAIYLFWGTETRIQFCTYILRYRYLEVPKHFEKYETISGKPFTSIIRKRLLFVLCREHPKVLASDKMSTVSFRRHFVFCICVKCVCKLCVCIKCCIFVHKHFGVKCLCSAQTFVYKIDTNYTQIVKVVCVKHVKQKRDVFDVLRYDTHAYVRMNDDYFSYEK